MNKIKSILATKIPAWEFMGEEEQTIVACEIWKAVNIEGAYRAGSFKITRRDLNIKLNGAVIGAEYALSHISSQLVLAYRDLMNWKSAPAEFMRDKWIESLEADIKHYEREIKRIGIFLKYDTDLVEAMIAQCDEHANRLVMA
jgi:hypothetical protein